jgi:MFS family permease
LGKDFLKVASKREAKFELSGRFNTIFRSLKYRNYRLFFSGQSISLIGTWMQRIAMPWLVYHLTGSPFMLGLVSFGGQIPTFLLAPLAGVITDKFNKYRVLLITQIVFLVQALVLAILTLSGVIHIWHIVILSIVLGCINAFDVPSRQSFVVEMVERKEDLGNAIALNSMMFNGARIIGPSIAGLILATAGEGMCFLINAVSFIFVIGSLLMMRIKPSGVKKSQGELLKDLKAGMNYVTGYAPIKHLLILLSIVSLMGASYQVLMPVFAKEVLHGGSGTFGFLMGAAGLGALAGALYLASRETVIKLGRIIPAAATLFGLSLVVLSFTSFPPVSILLMVFVGLGMMLNTASINTILQTITEDDKRGRVMSFYTMAIMGTAPFGSLIAGTLAKWVGTPETILIGGVSIMAGAFLFYRKLPELRQIVRPVYIKMGLIPEVVSGIQTATEPAVNKTDLTAAVPDPGDNHEI